MKGEPNLFAFPVYSEYMYPLQSVTVDDARLWKDLTTFSIFMRQRMIWIRKDWNANPLTGPNAAITQASVAAVMWGMVQWLKLFCFNNIDKLVLRLISMQTCKWVGIIIFFKLIFVTHLLWIVYRQLKQSIGFSHESMANQTSRGWGGLRTKIKMLPKIIKQYENRSGNRLQIAFYF